MKKLFLFAFIALVVAGCRKNDYSLSEQKSAPVQSYSGKYLRNYFSLLCRISQTTPGFFPPQVSRAYGYVGIANYEAVINGIDPNYTLAGQITGLRKEDLPHPDANLSYDWAIASNAAVADMMRYMFDKKLTAANHASIDSAENVNLTGLTSMQNTDVVQRSIQYGKAVAAALYEFSKTDGGHESYMDPFQLPYVVPADPACWVPTGAALHPVSPFWGNNRAMFSANVSGTDSYVPLAFSTDPASQFYHEAADVYHQVQNNTSEQVTITKYWADDPFNTCTPTGHTFNIMTQLLEENNATLEKSSVAYAKLCIAEMDAFIACWKTKYKTVMIRPVSYIKQYIDPSFTTVIGTPAFPTFTSGHSCEIGAGTKIFTDMFTDGSGNYDFTDYSQLRYGFAARHYANFNAMANECADSRFFGGIHFQMDNQQGLVLGRAIGDNINNLMLFPKNTR